MDSLSTLQEMILSLEAGTNLHISVLFFVPVHPVLQTDFPHVIHSSPFCDGAKERPRGMKRCMRCKNYATEKARRGEAFGGFCINGVYEYCCPVSVDGTVIAVAFAGNLVPDSEAFARKNAPHSVTEFLPRMETHLSEEQCRRTAEAAASYVRLLYQQYPVPAADKTGVLVQRLREYGDANYLYDVSLSQLAELFHYNEKYLGRIFKQETGQSFRQYVNSLRLKHARRLLRTTPMEIVDVALSSGFGTVTYFNRVFKERYGYPPSEYRKRAG